MASSHLNPEEMHVVEKSPRKSLLALMWTGAILAAAIFLLFLAVGIPAKAQSQEGIGIIGVTSPLPQKWWVCGTREAVEDILLTIQREGEEGRLRKGMEYYSETIPRTGEDACRYVVGFVKIEERFQKVDLVSRGKQITYTIVKISMYVVIDRFTKFWVEYWTWTAAKVMTREEYSRFIKEREWEGA
jgi:hypothetical protein